jgi:hypothetical protein
MSPNSQLKLLTVGASGLAAGLVVPELRKRGVHIRGLVHKKDDERTAHNLGAQASASIRRSGSGPEHERCNDARNMI